MVVDGKNITLTFGCTGQLSINNVTFRNFPFNGCTDSSNRVLYNQHLNCKKYLHGSDLSISTYQGLIFNRKR